MVQMVAGKLDALECYYNLNLNAVPTLSFDPAAAIPMKWGAVYMGVFMGFWGLCEYNIMPQWLKSQLVIQFHHSALQYEDHHSGFLVSPFQERGVMTQTYEKKWQVQTELFNWTNLTVDLSEFNCGFYYLHIVTPET